MAGQYIEEMDFVRLPSQCAVCRGWGAQCLCAECVALYAAARPRC